VLDSLSIMVGLMAAVGLILSGLLFMLSPKRAGELFKRLTVSVAVSERTVRVWIHSPVDPLPAVQVRGKILVRKSDFDRWLERHQVKPLGSLDLDGIVEEIVEEVRDGR